MNLATNRTVVWKWEEGGQVPDAAAQQVMASLFGIAPEDADPANWPYWLPVWDTKSVDAPWTPAGTVETLADLVRSGHMDRRGFLTITGATLTALAANWAEAPAAFASALDGDAVTDRMVTALEQRLDTLRSLDDEMGGARLLEQARGDLALITGLLKNARYGEAAGSRLYSLAARTSYLTGWMAYDSGLRSAGQEYYVSALRAARTSGDNALGAFILAEMGVHASDIGQDRERVKMTDTAVQKVPRTTPPGVLSYLELHRAEALSRNGQHRRAGQSLSRAFALWEKHGSVALPDWMRWYGEHQLHSTEGKILFRAGDVNRSVDALADSIARAVPRDRAVRSSRLATARLAGGDLDGALDAANAGLTLLESKVTSARAQERLEEFGKKLTPFRAEPRVKEFREHLRALPSAA
ncbi:transcriptional regulator [Streptomyces thermolineatus]|uniref:transcriptional regulator n=1 Tax=Streptomyces thermolineatus TaxID=44033 RepID=UPI0031D6EE4C